MYVYAPATEAAAPTVIMVWLRTWCLNDERRFVCRIVTSVEQVAAACTSFRSTPSVLQVEYQNLCPHTEVLTRAQAP
jgi:hypothetical protein